MDKKIEDALWPACHPEGSDPEGIVSCLTAAGYVIMPKVATRAMLDAGPGEPYLGQEVWDKIVRSAHQK